MFFLLICEAILWNWIHQMMLIIWQIQYQRIYSLYKSTPRDLVDEYAPLGTKEMLKRPLIPWYNKDIQVAKRHRRYCESSFCYMVYHTVQFLVLWCSRCIPILLGSLRSDMALNITCMLMKHSCV